MGKKFWLAFVAALVVMFALGSVFHVLVAAGFIERTFENVAKPDGFLIWGILVAYAFVALVMAWAYPKGYAGGSPVLEGLRFGLAVGILVHLSAAFEQFATMDLALGPILGDRLWHVVETVAGGITIALVHGRPSGVA